MTIAAAEDRAEILVLLNLLNLKSYHREVGGYVVSFVALILVTPSVHCMFLSIVLGPCSLGVRGPIVGFPSKNEGILCNTILNKPNGRLRSVQDVRGIPLHCLPTNDVK
jgi:uncharacterized membrane protein